MNKEFNNIWKFIKSEQPDTATMAISMANGLNEMDNTNYENSENEISFLELYTLIQKKIDFYNENIPDTLSPKLQMKIWFWFYVSALIQGRYDNANHNLTIWESYRKEVK
jgi:hypothetical protein